MSKRKLQDIDPEEQNLAKKAKYEGHKFEPKKKPTCDLGNCVLEYHRIYVSFDNYLWKKNNDYKGHSTYLTKRLFVNTNNIPWVDAICLNTKEECDFPAEWLVTRNSKWYVEQYKYMPKTTLAELGYNVICEHAQERSDQFAELAHECYLRFGGYILILDGTGRNLEALLKKGIPSSVIVIIDKKLLTSLYHKLLCLRLGESFEAHNTGEFQRFAEDGIEEMIRQNRVPHQKEITCAYFDFDCDIPKDLEKYLRSNKFPSLRLLGITQAKRNAKNPFPMLGKEIIFYLNSGGVRCRFSRIGRSKNCLTDIKEIPLQKQSPESKEDKKLNIEKLNNDDNMLQHGFEKDLDNPNTWVLIDEPKTTTEKIVIEID